MGTVSQAVDCNGAKELQPDAESKRLRWFEVALVTVVAFGGPILNSLYLLQSGPAVIASVPKFGWAAGLAHEISSLLLVGYILARHGKRFRDLGLGVSILDIGTGLFLTVTAYLAYWMGSIAIYAIHREIFTSAASYHAASEYFGHPSGIGVAYILFASVFEELIVRAYLMSEIKELTGSRTMAIVASVIIQGSYHLYYGWSVALSLAFSFAVFALYYAKSRRILPCIIAHELFDLYGLIQLL
jgi:membrane protease YdiL (CAAX protease family)